MDSHQWQGVSQWEESWEPQSSFWDQEFWRDQKDHGRKYFYWRYAKLLSWWSHHHIFQEVSINMAMFMETRTKGDKITIQGLNVVWISKAKEYRFKNGDRYIHDYVYLIMGHVATWLGFFEIFYIGDQGVANSFQDFLFQVLLRRGVETHPNWGICNVFLVRVEFLCLVPEV